VRPGNLTLTCEPVYANAAKSRENPETAQQRKAPSPIQFSDDVPLLYNIEMKRSGNYVREFGGGAT